MLNKTKIPFSLAAMLALIGVGMLTNAATAVSIEVKFDDPENFSDLEKDGLYSPDLVDRFESAIKDSLENEVAEELPEGSQLIITFHDIDLAGEYEPWRMTTQDVRIVRDIYPPRLKFGYRVLNASGEVLAQGTSQITDMNFLWNLPRRLWNNEEFYHEKQLMGEWAARKLPKLIENGEGVEKM